MTVRDYERYDAVWALEPLSGRVSASAPPGPCHGFVSLPQGRRASVAAVYAHAGRLWLQYGDRRWDCGAPDVRVRWSEAADGAGLFTVDGPGGRELTVEAAGLAPGPFDPGHDWIDTLERDFLRWAAERLSDPPARHALRELYLRGFARTG
ncbi:hypothetical protein ACX6XY_28850 [Streptomyces sp. O3]